MCSELSFISMNQKQAIFMGEVAEKIRYLKVTHPGDPIKIRINLPNVVIYKPYL